MQTRKRVSSQAGRWIVYLLFFLALVATWLVRFLLLPEFFFFVCLLLDIFLFFASLIALQISWQRFPAKPQSTTHSVEQRFPLAIHELLRLSPDEFEALVGLVIEAMGYTQVQQIGGSGDLGADLLARNYFNLRVIVQCKRFALDNQVTSPDLQRFLGSIVHYHALEGWFVTTSTFTQPALDFASMHSECIHLLSGDALVAFLQLRQHDIALILQQRKTMARVQ